MYRICWTQLDNPDLMTPRGGTSSGPDVDLDKTPNPIWKEIQNDELTKQVSNSSNARRT